MPSPSDPLECDNRLNNLDIKFPAHNLISEEQLQAEVGQKMDEDTHENGNGAVNEVVHEEIMSVDELAKIPPEYRADGRKIIKMRIVKTVEDFLSPEPSDKDFKPTYVYQYFKEPGDKEAEEAANQPAEIPVEGDEDEGSGASETEEEDEQGEDGRIVLPDENEGLIVGYKDLIIKLFFTPATLKPFISVNYSQALPLAQRSVPDLIHAVETMYGHKILTTSDAMQTAIQNDTKFTPFGRKMHEFTIAGNEKKTGELFEVGHESQNVGYPVRFAEYLTLVQPVLSWFIYAANVITADNSSWLHYFLYEKSPEGVFALMGYCSVYRYPVWPKAEEKGSWVGDHMERCRIAQFFVFPPYQKLGHGTRMLKAIIRRLQENPNTYDVTVEDPTPEFQNLFDTVTTCLTREYISTAQNLILDYKQPISAELIRDLHKKVKLSPEALKFAFGVLACMAARSEGQEAVKNYYDALTASVQKKIEDEIGDLDRSWRRVNNGYYSFSEDEFAGEKSLRLTKAGWQVNYQGQKDKKEKSLSPERIGLAMEKMTERTTHVAKRIDELV